MRCNASKCAIALLVTWLLFLEQRPFTGFTHLRLRAQWKAPPVHRCRSVCKAASVDPSSMKRNDLKSSIFNALDQDGDRRLGLSEMRRFAELSGFEGTDAEWQEEFQMLCDPQGCDLNAFGQLIDDDSEDGLFCSDTELVEMLQDLIQQGVSVGGSTSASRLGPAMEVGLEYFQREREAGLYDSEWKAWTASEGSTARTPRLGRVDALEGCPSTSTVQEAIMFVNEQVQNGIFGDQSGQAGNRLSELLAMQGASGQAGWFEFRIDENVLDEDQLAEMVLAPEGWQVDKSTIPTGYMMHIMSVGNGVKATLCGREGLHIVNSLHRDVSKCKRLCDTGLCGVVGRKRIVLLAPDVFPASSKVLRSPDMECQQLKPLSTLSEEDAWQQLEALAKTPGKGGVLDLQPGMFVFVPHGWWHAVRPIDDFTFITGPSQLSNLGVSTVS